MKGYFSESKNNKIKKVVLISDIPQNCTFLESIYEKNIYLYKINLTD